MNNYIIFTDLDGTLLDHHDYSFAQAIPALNKIRQLNIPIIINSSKTYAEIKDIRTQLHNNSAFAVENGAALFVPAEKQADDKQTFEQVILGTPIGDILETLHHLRKQHHFCFKGFSDYSIKALAEETGLSETQATQAKQRLASEPLKWLDTKENLVQFEAELNAQGLQLIQGGRFYHVMGENDKSIAMARLLNGFNKQGKILTIALGDSQNDKKMLEQADYAAVIRKQDNTFLPLNKNPERVIYSEHAAPLGWQEAIEQLFAKLNLGECNE